MASSVDTDTDVCIKRESPKYKTSNLPVTYKTQKNTLMIHINNVTKEIKSKYRIDYENYYYEFINKFIENIYQKCKIYHYNYSKNIIIDTNISKIRDNFTNNSYNFNIICFDKSLFYHIRYIYFILNSDKYTTTIKEKDKIKIKEEINENYDVKDKKNEIKIRKLNNKKLDPIKSEKTITYNNKKISELEIIITGKIKEISERIQTKYNFLLCCDHETFNNYKQNLTDMKEEISKLSENEILMFSYYTQKMWEKFNEYKTFSFFLNNLIEIKNFITVISASEYKDYIKKIKPEEYPKLEEKIFMYCLYERREMINIQNIKIYFLVSDNYLMKGIGAKRALINYFHNNMHNIETYHFRENYVCMNLDDNITMIGSHNKLKGKNPCTGRKCAQVKSDDSNDTYFNPPSCLKDCNIISILELYDNLKKDLILINEKDKDKDIKKKIVGIVKGAGTSDEHLRYQNCCNFDISDCCDKKNTYPYECKSNYKCYNMKRNTVYKLTLQKPCIITRNYNPFFTRFMEDMVFNILNHEDICKNMNKFLRFGHIKPQDNKDIDFEDFFNEKLLSSYILSDDGKTYKKVSGIQPIYLMYIHFLNVYLHEIHSTVSYTKPEEKDKPKEKDKEDEDEDYEEDDEDKEYDKKNNHINANDGKGSPTKYEFKSYLKVSDILFKNTSLIPLYSKSKYMHFGFVVYMLLLLLLNNKYKKSRLINTDFPTIDEIKKYICNDKYLNDDLNYNTDIFSLKKEFNIKDIIKQFEFKTDDHDNDDHDIRYIDTGAYKYCNKISRVKCTINYKKIIKNIIIDFGLFKIDDDNLDGYLNFFGDIKLTFLETELKLVKNLLNNMPIDQSKLSRIQKITDNFKEQKKKNDIFVSNNDRKYDYLGDGAISSINFCKYCLTNENKDTLKKYLADQSSLHMETDYQQSDGAEGEKMVVNTEAVNKRKKPAQSDGAKDENMVANTEADGAEAENMVVNTEAVNKRKKPAQSDGAKDENMVMNTEADKRIKLITSTTSKRNTEDSTSMELKYLKYKFKYLQLKEKI